MCSIDDPMPLGFFGLFFCFVLCGWGFGDGLGSLLSLGECSKTMEKTISYPEMSNLTYMKHCKKGVNYSILCVTGLWWDRLLGFYPSWRGTWLF